MTDKKDVTKPQTGETQETPKAGREMRPAVDIFEDDTGITLLADMPGVSKDRLDIQVDKDTLSIAGEVDLSMPEGMEALYADIRSTRYERGFALSGEMDTEKIEAALRDGVLSLRIPKRAELQPRKIKVEVG
jgi:HSP20 family molecular chaperone IbpA